MASLDPTVTPWAPALAACRYTEDGLFVDTAFVSGTLEQRSLFGLPGEFFAGRFFHNRDDGHVYAQMGKASMALFRLRGWANGTARAMEMSNKSFGMTAALIGPPSMDAIDIRRHGNVDSGVNTAVFRRTQLPPAIDGSARGWDASDSNVSLWADGSHHVSAQLLHDDDTIYVRATIRLGAPLQPVKLYPDFQRLFVHGTGATTLSLYLQVRFPRASDRAPPLCGMPTRTNTRLPCDVFLDTWAMCVLKCTRLVIARGDRFALISTTTT